MYCNVKSAVRIFSPIVTLCASGLRVSRGQGCWLEEEWFPLICGAYIVCDGISVSINLGDRRFTDREACWWALYRKR